MSQENVEVIRAMFEAWNRRDFAAAQAAWAPEIVIEMSTDSIIDGTYRGYEGLAEVMRFWGAFAEFRSDVREARPVGDKVFITVHHFGRGKGSGVDVEMENWQIFTLREGRITRYEVYATREQALEAAGLSE
jgi:ketosteroid isomerase-like protein